jgi:hypothetical protein
LQASTSSPGAAHEPGQVSKACNDHERAFSLEVFEILIILTPIKKKKEII